jgi:hypothetical protein
MTNQWVEMATSWKDALVKAGLVKPEETAEGKRERDWRERRAREAAEVAARLADPTLPPRWEPAPTGHIVDSSAAPRPSEPVVCARCGEPFDPTAAEHKQVGRTGECGSCVAGEATGPKRKRGQMVWTHKTAPTLEIEGGRPLTPEEIAAMRRR